MAFEFFFGVFGLISSDSKSRHKSRVENEWRLSTPLDAGLFRESGRKSPLATGGSGGGSSSPSGAFKTANDLKRPIFSTTGTLAAASGGGVGGGGVGNMGASGGEALFSSASSSSASSVASSGSNLTTNSSSAFIKPAAGDQTKKYEFRATQASGGGLIGGDTMKVGSRASAIDSVGRSTDNLIGAGLGSSAKLSSDETLLDGLGSEQEQPSSSSGGLGVGSSTPAGEKSRTKRLRMVYCVMVCLFLWFHVLRLLVGLLVEKSLFTLDFFCLGTYRIHFLIPALCLAIQAAAVSLIFIRNNDETNWLVPFYSSKDYLIRSRSNFKPKIEDYTRRVNVSVVLAIVLALISSLSLSAYIMHCVGRSELLAQPNGDQAFSAGVMTAATSSTNSTSQMGGSDGLSQQSRLEQMALYTLLAMDIVWAVYSTYICFLVSFYFNLICSIMKSRFHGISNIIEDLAESNTTKTTNQARKITTLYLEHNEACELLDESNDFWQYLIFFTYFTYIPAYCYCLYNLFFVDFEAWPSFITWVIHTHTGFIILLISFSAAGVSTEAHAPYTSLHTLSLIQLPLDVEVNIATFLHRVRGLTIGYSCYDLFAITNASMSNTAAACASYFLIVADFSRSSVFSLAQMNGSSSAAAAAAAAAAGGAPTTPTPL